MKKSIILAAGKGTRMKSDLPKVAHKVCGREMINLVLDATKEAGIEEDVVVVGYRGDVVKEVIDRPVKFAEQTEQLGTGHAVKMAKEFIGDDDLVMILYGDVPLLRAETLKEMFEYNEKTNADITMCTSILDDPSKYGRIIKDENENVIKIVEYKDATPEELAIKEINVGNCIYKGKVLREMLDKITNDNVAGEYYLTQTIDIGYKEGLKINSYILEDFSEGFGANSPEELAEAEKIFMARKK